MQWTKRPSIADVDAMIDAKIEILMNQAEKDANNDLGNVVIASGVCGLAEIGLKLLARIALR